MTALRVRPATDRDVDEAADDDARAANLDLALRFLGAAERIFAEKPGEE